MKAKNKIKKLIFGLTLATIIALSAMLMTACPGAATYRQNALSNRQPTTFNNTPVAVLSNGGSAVQMGGFVYHLNGFDGFIDNDGNSNTWGNVEKGALARSSLMGNTVIQDFHFHWSATPVPLAVFEGQVDRFTGTDFNTTAHHITTYQKCEETGDYLLDDDDNKIEVVWNYPAERELMTWRHDANVDIVAPKRVGTSGFDGGGIFIMGDWIYYASPHNLRDGSGVVQTGRTDFFRTSLDRSVTHRLYTTVDRGTSASPYAFYAFGSSHYLLVLDGTDIVSIPMHGNRARDVVNPRIIAQNVSRAYFPTREIYFDGITQNVVENFIFWERAATKDDNNINGNVIEIMRPDGSERAVIYNGGGNASILGTDNGIFFYRDTDSFGNVRVTYSNLHNVLIGRCPTSTVNNPRYISPTYRAQWYPNAPFGLVQGTISSAELGSFTTLIGLRPDGRNADEVFVLGLGGSAELFSAAQGGTRTILLEESATFVAVRDNTLFLNVGGASLVSLNLFTGNDRVTLVESASTAPVFVFDVLREHVMFFDSAEQIFTSRATNYSWFLRLEEGAKPVLVSRVIESERDSETNGD